MRRLVSYQSSPVHPVSEYRGGSLSMTQEEEEEEEEEQGGTCPF